NSLNESLNASIMLTKRFKKLRRSLTLNTSVTNNTTDGTSNYFSNTNFRQLNDSLLIDQFKNNVWENTNFNSTLNYTEPLTKYLTATAGYTLGSVSSFTLNQSFNKNEITGNYDQRDQGLLNDFDNITLRNSVNTGLNYKKNTITVNLSNSFRSEERRVGKECRYRVVQYHSK